MNKIEIQTTNKVRIINSLEELFIADNERDIKHIVQDKILKNTNFRNTQE